MTSIPSLNQMGWKLTNLGHFEIFTKNRDLAGRAGRSKNGRSHFNLILWCFWAIISHHTKFHPNRMINTEFENFHYWSVLVGWGGRAKNGRSYFKLNLCSFWAIISPHTKFHPNLMKNTEVENFCYWLVLVGRGGSGWVGSDTFPVLGFWGILYRGVHITQID